MGKSKPKASSSRMDPDFKNAWMEQYSNAQGIASNLGARKFAGFTPDWMSGAGMARQFAGAGQDALNLGLGAAGGVAGYTPQTMPGMDRSAYMNPYMDQVADRTMLDMDRQRQLMQQGIGDQAARGGAFGGSRHGVAEAETNRGFGDLFGNQMAQLRMAGFDNASGLMQGDANRAMQGQQLNLAGAGMLGQLGSLQQNLGLTGASALQNLGSQQQQFSQQQMDAIRNLPMEQQQYIMQVMQANPGGGGGMINTGGTPGSSGFLGAIAPVAGAFLGGPLAANMFGGAGGAAASGAMSAAASPVGMSTAQQGLANFLR